MSGKRTAEAGWNCRHPVYPEPDWSTAPEWAQWWAVAAHGDSYWFQHQPVTEGGFWWDKIPELGRTRCVWAAYVGVPDRMELPLGCDWRLTLRRRPGVTE